MKAFPLFITTSNRTVLIFGGGAEAAAKLRLALKTDANVLVIAESIAPNEMQLGKAKHVAQDPLDFIIPSNVAFAYAATGDKRVDAQIAERGRQAGFLICAADQPDVSDFSTPALVDRDPVIIAIGTEGTAPVLARKLKAQIERLIPKSLGQIARYAAALRPWVARHVEGGATRRQFWQSFFTAPDLTSQFDANQTALNLHHASQHRTAKVQLLLVTSDDIGALSLNAHKALDTADAVLSQPDVPRTVTELCRREAQTLDTQGLAQHRALILDLVSHQQSVLRVITDPADLTSDYALLQGWGLTPQILPWSQLTPLSSMPFAIGDMSWQKKQPQPASYLSQTIS